MWKTEKKSFSHIKGFEVQLSRVNSKPFHFSKLNHLHTNQNFFKELFKFGNQYQYKLILRKLETLVKLFFPASKTGCPKTPLNFRVTGLDFIEHWCVKIGCPITLVFGHPVLLTLAHFPTQANGLYGFNGESDSQVKDWLRMVVKMVFPTLAGSTCVYVRLELSISITLYFPTPKTSDINLAFWFESLGNSGLWTSSHSFCADGDKGVFIIEHSTQSIFAPFSRNLATMLIAAWSLRT